MSEEAVGEVASAIAATDVIGVRVADLTWWLDAREADLRLAVGPSHAKFLVPRPAEVGGAWAVPGNLVLRVQNIQPRETRACRTPLCVTEIWELWLDDAGRYVFVAPRQSPPRQAIVDPSYTSGEVLGEFSTSDGRGLYPLQGLDSVLFTNWLASFGGVMLHASGVAVDGKGYCFVGPGGSGKSTLAAHLSLNHSAVVLGEDQVVLRLVEGRFWMFGTPWHLDPAMCSPRGVRLEKLFFLDRGARQCVEVVTPADGVARLLQTAFVPYYRPAAVAAILNCLVLLSEQVPFHSLAYRLGSDVLTLVSEA